MLKRHGWTRFIIALCVACAFASTALTPTSFASSASPTPRPSAAPKPTKAKPASSVSRYTDGELTGDNIYAQCAILMDAKTGKVLFEKNPDRPMYPASITKLLTAMLVLENCSLDDVVTITKESTNVEPTIIGLTEGEQLSVSDLMHGMLMKSGNDAAIALAVHVAGSVSEFSAMMSAKAETLGLKSSAFANPNGLNSTKHYTTAADYILVVREAAKSTVIRDLCATLVYTIEPTNKAGRRTVENTNEFLHDSGKAAHYEYGLGLKTGYTSDAAYTYAGLAEKDGVTLISVVLGSTKAGKWSDTALMMDYGFSMFSTINLASLYNAKKATVVIENASDDDPEGGILELSLHNPDDPLLTGFQVSKADKSIVEDGFSRQVKIEVDEANLQAPILTGAPLGMMIYTLGDQTVEAQLVASRDVKKNVMYVAPGILHQMEDNATIQSIQTISNLWWVVLLPLFGVGLLVLSFALDRSRRKRRSYSRYFVARKGRF